MQALTFYMSDEDRRWIDEEASATTVFPLDSLPTIFKYDAPLPMETAYIHYKVHPADAFSLDDLESLLQRQAQFFKTVITMLSYEESEEVERDTFQLYIHAVHYTEDYPPER